MNLLLVHFQKVVVGELFRAVGALFAVVIQDMIAQIPLSVKLDVALDAFERVDSVLRAHVIFQRRVIAVDIRALGALKVFQFLFVVLAFAIRVGMVSVLVRFFDRNNRFGIFGEVARSIGIRIVLSHIFCVKRLKSRKRTKI